VTLTGWAPISFTLVGGAETHVAFPVGAIGGPVKISSTQPVLASQLVQYYQSFNEVLAAAPSQAVQTSYFQWFDRATPGMVGDNIHILNPGSTAASVSVTLPGANDINVSVAAGAEVHVAFPVGSINGPVTVSSSVPVLASPRVQYYQSFNEVAAAGPAAAQTTSYVMWFDTATPGMVGDNIHILNPGSTSASVMVSMPGRSPINVSVAAGAEAHVSFPIGSLGGPVTITSSQPVLAAQRVQYFQSFNELPAAA